MAPSLELEKYGEPLTYDKSFKGPREKRSCTDVPCLLIFAVFLAGWGYVAYYAIHNGDLNTLLVPTDSQNQKCGVDSSVINKPYLFFFNLQKCIDPLVPINGCPTPQVCIENCPTETFIFDEWKGNNLADLRNKLICTPTINKEQQIANYQQAKDLVDNQLCARWYVKSKPFLNRCIWETSSICEISSLLLNRNRRETWQQLESQQQNDTQYLSLNNKNINLTNNLDQIKIENNNFLKFNYEEIIPKPLAIMLDKAAKQYLSDDELQIYDQQRSINEPKFQCDRRTKLGEQIIVEKVKRTDTYLSRFVGNFIAHFYDGIDAQELAQKIVEDIISSWVTICMALVISMMASLLFIAIMRWLAAPMVWFSLIGVTAALGYGIYYSVTQYIYWKNTETVPQHSPNLGSTIKNIIQDKNTWLYLSIGLSVIFIIILLLIIFLRKRIVIAIAIIKEGSKAVATVFSSVFFPILPWILHIATIAFAIAIGLYLASIGEPTFKVLGSVNKADSKCLCSGNATRYTTGSSCHPDEFNKFCSQYGKPGCVDAGCYFEKIKSPKIINYFHAYNVVGFFWLAFFISAFGEMVLAATFAAWYWTFHKSEVPYFILTKAFFRTIRYHLGTLAIGSLLVTICRIIRLILEYIHSKLKKYDNEFTRCILCCMKCFFWCLENFLRFINKNAYIMCAIHGKNFCTSAKDAFNLLMRNVLRVVTIDKVTDFVFFMSKILLTLAAGAGLYFYLVRYSEHYQLHYIAVPTTVVVIGTYLITTVFFGVYSMAVDTLFLCFLEDSERNDGSPEKPYFMSKQLMKILGKRNQIPRSQYS